MSTYKVKVARPYNKAAEQVTGRAVDIDSALDAAWALSKQYDGPMNVIEVGDDGTESLAAVLTVKVEWEP